MTESCSPAVFALDSCGALLRRQDRFGLLRMQPAVYRHFCLRSLEPRPVRRLRDDSVQLQFLLAQPGSRESLLGHPGAPRTRYCRQTTNGLDLLSGTASLYRYAKLLL